MNSLHTNIWISVPNQNELFWFVSALLLRYDLHADFFVWLSGEHFCPSPVTNKSYLFDPLRSEPVFIWCFCTDLFLAFFLITDEVPKRLFLSSDGKSAASTFSMSLSISSPLGHFLFLSKDLLQTLFFSFLPTFFSKFHFSFNFII